MAAFNFLGGKDSRIHKKMKRQDQRLGPRHEGCGEASLGEERGQDATQIWGMKFGAVGDGARCG